MRNICYAKPVQNGYSIVGFKVKQYTTPILPAVCQHSGQPVILLESAHDFVLKANAKAQTVLENFSTKLNALWSETIQDVNTAREDWDEAANGADTQESIELVAQYLAYCAAGRLLQTAGSEVSQSSRGTNRAIDGICTKRFSEEATRAGFELPITRREPKFDIFTLLSSIFGSTGMTGLPTEENNESSNGKMAATQEAVTV